MRAKIPTDYFFVLGRLLRAFGFDWDGSGIFGGGGAAGFGGAAAFGGAFGADCPLALANNTQHNLQGHFGPGLS